MKDGRFEMLVGVLVGNGTITIEQGRFIMSSEFSGSCYTPFRYRVKENGEQNCSSCYFKSKSYDCNFCGYTGRPLVFGDIGTCDAFKTYEQIFESAEGVDE